jgi:U3 small nucleolar RNA-associated protein 25
LKKKFKESFKKELNTLHKNLAPLILEGKDLLCPVASHSNIQQIRELYCLQAIDQIYKYLSKEDLQLTLTYTELKILLSIINIKLASDGLPEDDSPFKDQGFTRPSTLIILPTRNACLKVVNTLTSFSATTQQEKKLDSQKITPSTNQIQY